MANQLENIALESVSYISVLSRTIVESNQKSLLQDAETFVNRMIPGIFLLNGGDENKGWQDLFFRYHQAARRIINFTVMEPQIKLTNAGPHLLFAEVWLAYAAVLLFERTGHAEFEEVCQLAQFCCLHMVNWAKSGYRMDWLPKDSSKQKKDPSAPIGSWTVEWAKNNKL